MRYCYYCKITKPETDFSSSHNKFHAGRKVGRCRICTSIKNKAYRAEHLDELKAYEKARRALPEKKEQDRQRSYPRRYGITREQYNEMREAQHYRCAICGLHEEESKISRWGHLCLDHDHKTGKVRALLCARCNKGLGCFNDEKELLSKAIKYLNFYAPRP